MWTSEGRGGAAGRSRRQAGVKWVMTGTRLPPNRITAQHAGYESAILGIDKTSYSFEYLHGLRKGAADETNVTTDVDWPYGSAGPGSLHAARLCRRRQPATKQEHLAQPGDRSRGNWSAWSYPTQPDRGDHWDRRKRLLGQSVRAGPPQPIRGRSRAGGVPPTLFGSTLLLVQRPRVLPGPEHRA